MMHWLRQTQWAALAAAFYALAAATVAFGHAAAAAAPASGPAPVDLVAQVLLDDAGPSLCLGGADKGGTAAASDCEICRLSQMPVLAMTSPALHAFKSDSDRTIVWRPFRIAAPVAISPFGARGPPAGV